MWLGVLSIQILINAQLSEQHGVETYLHFIRRLIVHSQARLTGGPGPGVFDASSGLTFRLLMQEAQRLGRDPFLADRFRDGIDRGDGDVFRHFDLLRFNERLALRPLERLVLASAIVAGPNVRRELVQQALTVIQIEFDAAVLALAHEPVDLSPSQLAKLLSNLLALPAIDAPVLDASQREALIGAAHVKYGPEVVAPMLQQIMPHLRYGNCISITYSVSNTAFQLAAGHIICTGVQSAWAKGDERR